MQRREGYTALTTCQPLYMTSRKEFQSEEKKKRLTWTNKFTSHCYTSAKFCLLCDCSCVSMRTAAERFPCLSSGLSEGTCSSLSSSHVDILSDGHLIISWLTLVKFRHRNYLKRSRKCPVALGFLHWMQTPASRVKFMCAAHRLGAFSLWKVQHVALCHLLKLSDADTDGITLLVN